MTNRKASAALMLAMGCTLPFLAYPARASGANNGIDATDNGAMIASLGTNAVPRAELDKIRAGSGTVSAINLGTNTGNSVENSFTGSISNAQSIDGNTGLTNVMQNTGNNALLQSSMTVNITVH